jgi:uncharacterized delta-60 repeat protein/uncharacterized repeat protein (TIGR01451 family)
MKRNTTRLSLLPLEDRATPAVGGLDLTFAGTGKVVVAAPATGGNSANAVAEQVDGKIIVVGQASGLATSAMRIQRFNADGSNDTTFNSTGVQTIRFGSEVMGQQSATAVAIQADGKIVVAGFTNDQPSADNDFAVARLNPNGTLDTTFDGDGRQTIAFNNVGSNNDDQATAVAIQGDGKIVLGGFSAFTTPDYDFAFVRLNSNGALDNTFDTDGKQVIQFDIGGGKSDKLTSLVIQPDGRILGVGYADSTAKNTVFAATRLTSNGSSDLAFNIDGKTTVDFGETSRANAVALRPDGRIVLVGMWDDNLTDFAIAQLKTDGTLDPSFGGAGGAFAVGSGVANLTFGTGTYGQVEVATGVKINPDGNIVVSGYTDNDVAGGSNYFAVARLQADGKALDTTFDTDGKQIVDFGGDDKSSGMLLQADGRILLVGTSSNTKVALARLDQASTDLGVVFTSNLTQYTPGQPAIYRITVSNFGPTDVSGVQLTTTFPAIGLNGTAYTSSVIGGATGSTSGLGLPNDLLALPSGGQVSYTITGTFPSSIPTGPYVPAVALSGTGFFDTDPVDNTASISNLIVPLPTLLVGGATDGSATLFTPTAGQYGSATNQSLFPSAVARVVTADVNGDGTPDLIAGAGPGVRSTLRILDGKTNAQLVSFNVFEDAFTGGVYVAALDMNGDGKAEVVVCPDLSGGAVAAVYDGAKLASGITGDSAQIFRYFGIDDPAFRGGARPAFGDVNGDGVADLLIAAGFGGGPRITFWDGASVLAKAPMPIANFFAFETALRNGAFIAAGDVNGDGIADVAFGGGPNGAPRVRIFTGFGIVSGGNFTNLDNLAPATQLANFFAGPNTLRGGVRVALKDVDGDGRADLITGSGEKEAARARVFKSTNFLVNATPNADQELPLFGNAVLANGVFVG